MGCLFIPLPEEPHDPQRVLGDDIFLRLLQFPLFTSLIYVCYCGSTSPALFELLDNFFFCFSVSASIGGFRGLQFISEQLYLSFSDAGLKYSVTL